MRKASVVSAIVILLVVGIVFGAVAKEAPKTIKIGSSCPLTGPFGSGGAMLKAGYEIAVEDVNQKGGVFVKEFNKKIPWN